MKNFSIIIAIAAGCLLTGFSSGQMKTGTSKAKTSLDIRSTPAHNIRDDIQLVNNAILLVMRGKALPKDTENILKFSAFLQRKLRANGGNCDGFVPSLITFIGYKHSATDPKRIHLTEGVYLIDAYAREIAGILDIQYLLGKDKVTIEQVSFQPYCPIKPSIRLFYLPAKKVPRDIFTKYDNHAKLLTFLHDNELSQNQLSEPGRSLEDVYIFACAMDQVGPDAKLSIRITLPDGKIIGENQGMSVNYQGWAVGVLRSKFIAANSKATVDVYIKPGKYLPQEKRTDTLICKIPLGKLLIKKSTDQQSGRQLEPIADSNVYAYTYANWNKSNWGASNTLHTGWHPVGGERRTYLKFDLSELPPDSFESAKLRLYHYHTGGQPTLKLNVYPVSQNWKEGVGTYPPRRKIPADKGEITWIDQPACDKTICVSFQPDKFKDEYVEVDVTDIVKGWVGGKENHGVMIAPAGKLSRSTKESMYGFFSREHKDKNKRPVLILSSKHL